MVAVEPLAAEGMSDKGTSIKDVSSTLRVARTAMYAKWVRGAMVACVVLLAACWALRRSRAQEIHVTVMPGAEFVASPNCDDRSGNAPVSCIVLHATVAPTTEGTERIFLDKARLVSAHFVVGKDGKVVQMVPLEKRAWHAGASVLEGVKRVNDYSVGIEIVNLNDGKDPYTEAQYQAVANIIRFIRTRYDVPDARIVSHAQIALPPGRKSDPVNLDFDRVRQMAKMP
jgi:N-acetylmuramoyl-L-alanine amidase